MQNNQNNPHQSKIPVQIGVGILVILLYFGVVVYNKRSSDSTDVTTNNEVVNTLPNNSINNSRFRNGSYTATGSYLSPGGLEKFDVNLTIANGVVTNSTVTPIQGNPTSFQFQKEFAENYKQFVVGKNITDLKLSKVAGSSITSEGFNHALEKIKAQAGT